MERATLDSLYREVFARRARRERVARLAVLSLSVFLTVAGFYAATN